MPKKNQRFNRYVGLPGDCFSQSFDAEDLKHGYYFDEELKQRVFGVVSKTNVYEDIQSYKAICDTTILKEQLLSTGSDIIDESLFADVSALPRDMLSSFAVHQEAVATFDRLPSVVRYKYGNDYTRFVKEFNINDFIKQDIKQDIIEKNNEKISEVIKDEK